MKAEDLAILGIGALAIYYFFFKNGAAADGGGGGGAVSPPAPTVTPTVTQLGPEKIYITERGAGGQRAVIPLTPVGIAKAVVISKAIARSQEGKPITGFAQRLAKSYGIELPHQMPFRTPIGARGTGTARLLTIVAARRGR